MFVVRTRLMPLQDVTESAHSRSQGSILELLNGTEFLAFRAFLQPSVLKPSDVAVDRFEHIVVQGLALLEH